MTNKNNSPFSCTLTAHDGLAMTADCRGQGEPLLLFVHGWTCRREYWRPQLSHFGAIYRVAAPDLPGHGKSGSRGRTNWSVTAFAQDIAACADELKAAQVILIGHSMGGAVALEAARRMGKTTLAVILADTFVIDYGGLSQKNIRDIASPFEADFEGAISGLVEQTSTAATPESLKARLAREMSQADPSWALPVWRDLLAWSPAAAFNELKVPVHAINGALIPQSARERCAPFVQETIMGGAGHFLQMENPAKFNRILDDILAIIL